MCIYVYRDVEFAPMHTNTLSSKHCRGEESVMDENAGGKKERHTCREHGL